jgi:predicted GH43/DUF377 family glycosyl hydrolase
MDTLPTAKPSSQKIFYAIGAVLLAAIIIAAIVFIAMYKPSQPAANTTLTSTTTTQAKVINFEEVSWAKVNATIEAPSNQGGTEGRLPLGLRGTGDSKGIIPGSVIKVGGEYKLWYSGMDDKSTWRIYMATSTNATEWKKVDNTIPKASNAESTQGRIALGVPGKGDEELVRNPAVIYREGKYYMWYAGGSAVGHDHIYQATSLDGLTWTKTNNSQPARSDTAGKNGQIPLGNLGRGDDFNIEYVSVVAQDQNTLFAYYTGENNNQSGPSQISIYGAKSIDNGTTWEKINNRVSLTSTEGRLALGAKSSGDQHGLLYPAVVFSNGAFYMTYTGFQQKGPKITNMTAKSTDGLTWTKLSPIAAFADPKQVVINAVIYKDQNELFMLYGGAAGLDLKNPAMMYTARAEE